MNPPLHKSPLYRCIDAILNRKGRFFSSRQIAEKMGTKDLEIVRSCLRKLAKEGHLATYRLTMENPGCMKGNPGMANVIYTALPSLEERRHGTNYKHPDCAWDRMWKVIRVLKRFKRRDLTITANVTDKNAGYFLNNLRKAGYVETVGVCKYIEWVLTHDPGPERPSWGEIKRRIDEMA